MSRGGSQASALNRDAESPAGGCGAVGGRIGHRVKKLSAGYQARHVRVGVIDRVSKSSVGIDVEHAEAPGHIGSYVCRVPVYGANDERSATGVRVVAEHI